MNPQEPVHATAWDNLMKCRLPVFALALLSSTIIVGISAPAAQASPAPLNQSQPLTKLGDLSNYSLLEKPVSRSILANFDSAMPVVSLNTVLGATSTAVSMRHDTSCATSDALPNQPPASQANLWCWGSKDENDGSWQPQGLTTSYEFDASDAKEGPYRALISGWTGTILGPQGQRINYGDGKLQVVNYSTNPPTYHTVYLAESNSTGTGIAQISSHLGGVVWSGGHLLITGQKHANNFGETALYDFDFDNLRKVDTSSPPSSCPTIIFGQGCDGKYRAYGYPYIMLVTRRYVWNPPSQAPQDCGNLPLTSRGFCFDSLSLDKTTSPYTIVGSEYVSDQSNKTCGNSSPADDDIACGGMRVLRYKLDQQGNDFGLAVNSAREANPSSGVLSHVPNEQGIESYNGGYYIARSGARGGLWHAAEGEASTTACPDANNECWAGVASFAGAEAISDDHVYGLLWSQTECAFVAQSPYPCVDKRDSPPDAVSNAKVLFAVDDIDLPEIAARVSSRR